jgi:hypothetical protein
VGSNPTLSAILKNSLKSHVGWDSKEFDLGTLKTLSINSLDIIDSQSSAHEPGSCATTVRESRQVRKEAAVSGFRVCRREARARELFVFTDKPA